MQLFVPYLPCRLPQSKHFQGYVVEVGVAQRHRPKERKKRKRAAPSSPSFSLIMYKWGGGFDLPCPPESHSEVGVRCDGCGTR